MENKSVKMKQLIFKFLKRVIMNMIFMFQRIILKHINNWLAKMAR